MDENKVLTRLAGWARTFPGPIPTIAQIEAALRGEIDAETKRGLCSYAGEKLWNRYEVEVTPFCEYGSEEWPADDFISMMRDAIDQIPVHLRGTAIVELKGGHDESTALQIKYRRPQTDEEMAIEMGQALMHIMKREHEDMVTYQRLSKKFAAH